MQEREGGWEGDSAGLLRPSWPGFSSTGLPGGRRPCPRFPGRSAEGWRPALATQGPGLAIPAAGPQPSLGLRGWPGPGHQLQDVPGPQVREAGLLEGASGRPTAVGECGAAPATQPAEQELPRPSWVCWAVNPLEASRSPVPPPPPRGCELPPGRGGGGEGSRLSWGASPGRAGFPSQPRTPGGWVAPSGGRGNERAHKRAALRACCGH